jgi:hypothetical protein
MNSPVQPEDVNPGELIDRVDGAIKDLKLKFISSEDNNVHLRLRRLPGFNNSQLDEQLVSALSRAVKSDPIVHMALKDVTRISFE